MDRSCRQELKEPQPAGWGIFARVSVQFSFFNILQSSVLSLSYSHLNAVIGSTFVALLAGMKHADTATAPSRTAIPPKVNGSVAVTPKSMLVNSRVTSHDPVSPKATPNSTSDMPCRIT